MGKDYVFATARVRSVEKNLLTREKVEKMVDSKTPADALKVLYDSDYGYGGEPVREENFEELLTEETKKTYEFVLSIAPDKEPFRLFQYPYDYHNLKTLMKAEFLGIDPMPLLMSNGSIEVNKMAVMVRERNFLSMTTDMKNAMLEVIDVFSRTNDPQIIDLIFDKACYTEMAKLASAANNAFLRRYVGLLIDTINLKTFVRMREMGKTWDFFNKVFIPGGNVPEKLFVSGYDEAYEQFAEKLLPFGLNTALAEGGAMVKDAGRFTMLEKLCDNMIIQFARGAKHVTFGMEPMAAYLIAKENEIKTARIIMAGLLADLPRDTIKERLRETYA